MVAIFASLSRLASRSRWLTRAAAPLSRPPFKFLAGPLGARRLIRLRFGERLVALTNDPDIVSEVMLDRERIFDKSDEVTWMLEPLIGAGVFALTGGDEVPARRRIYTRALGRIANAEIEATAERLTTDYAARWVEAGRRGAPICQDSARLTIDVVALCAFGRTFSEAESRRFTELFFAYQRRCQPMPLMCLRDDKAAKARLIRHMGLAEIGAKMRSIVYERFLRDPDPSAPFPAALAEADGLGPDLALDETMMLLLAGHETTAAALSWLFWILAGDPTLQETARARRDEDAYLDALCKETLRLYPPIAFFARAPQRDVVFRETPVPAGDVVLATPFTLHRHPRRWREAARFDPERWLDAAAPARGVYIPFGLGPRRCPGEHFAVVEMRRILRVVLGRVRLSRASRRTPRPLGSLTLRPDREIPLLAAPLEPAETAGGSAA